MTNTYFLFAGDRYYPAGGMNDFVGVFIGTLDAAKAEIIALARGNDNDWWQIAALNDYGVPVVLDFGRVT
jgi:hypothetical protein